MPLKLFFPKEIYLHPFADGSLYHLGKMPNAFGTYACDTRYSVCALCLRDN